MRISAPDTEDEVLAPLADDPYDTRVIAGGTALVTMMRQRLVAPAHLVSLHRLRGLHYVEVREGALRVGALLPQSALETDPLIRELYPVIPEALQLASNVRVRNVATLGGALVHADPNQDSTTLLLALDASVILRSSGGERTVPLEEFFVDYYETAIEPGELLVEVVLPLPDDATQATFQKFLPRSHEDYGVVNVAASMRRRRDVCEDVRIALGCVADVPLRATAAETMLRGRSLSSDSIAEADRLVADVVDPVSDTRGSAAWKSEMAVVWVRRAIAALAA